MPKTALQRRYNRFIAIKAEQICQTEVQRSLKRIAYEKKCGLTGRKDRVTIQLSSRRIEVMICAHEHEVE